MKTLHVGNDWFGERQGGLSRYLAGLTAALPNVGVSAYSLVVGDPQAIKSQGASFESLSDRKVGLPMRLYNSRTTIQRVRETYKPDLLASHFALYTLSMLDKLRDLPMVVHFHGPWAAESGLERHQSAGIFIKRQIERLVYERGMMAITLSEAFQRELSSRYNIDPDRIKVIPGGVDTLRFSDGLSRAEARRSLGWPEKRPTVLCIRRHVQRMGLETLLVALEGIAKQVPDVLVHLGGSGPLTSMLSAQIKSRGLEENVRLIGRISEQELPLAYRAADLSVVPSEALEGFGMIVVESLACGTPVMVTPVGGLPEILHSFAPECIFRDTSAQAMESGLIGVLSGAQSLPSSQACREHATANYGWNHIAARVVEVYKEALA